MTVNYYELLAQEDLNVGIGVGTKRNPGGGTLVATQIGMHSLAIGQAVVELDYDPPPINSLGRTTIAVTVQGAGLGDFVLASFKLPLGGLIMFAEVTGDNVVTVTFFNPTTAAIDITARTIRILVFKSR